MKTNTFTVPRSSRASLEATIPPNTTPEKGFLLLLLGNCVQMVASPADL